MKQRLFTRNFSLLILGQTSSLIGNYSLKFALSMYVLEQTGSASVFAGLMTVSLLPTILLSPFGGILADRANRRNIMVSLDALSGLSVLLSSLLLPLGNEITVIGLLLVILSVLGAFESPTVQACVPQMLSGDNVLKGNAAVNQIQALASLLAPFLGSIFYTAFGIRTVLWATVACFFLTALLEYFIHLDYRKPAEKLGIIRVVKSDFSASMRFLFREEPVVLKLLLLAALISMLLVGVLVIGFPFLVRNVLGLSAEHYGAAESALGASAILGSIVIGVVAAKMKVKHMPFIIAAAGFCFFPAGLAFLMPLSAFARYLVLLFFFCLCQMVCCMFSVYAISLIQQRTPEHLTGKVMSYVYTISLCAQPFGQMIYGFLFDFFTDQVYWVLIVTGIIICGIAATTTNFLRKMKDMSIHIDNS